MKRVEDRPFIWAILLTLICVHALWLTFYWGTDEVQSIIGNTLSVLPPVICFFLVLSAARFQKDPFRRAWLLIAYGIGAWAAGNVIWAIYELALGREVFPSPADFGYLSLPLLFALGFLQLAQTALKPGEHVRLGIDALIIVASAGVVSWHVLLAPIIAAFGTLSSGLVVALAYPVLDLLLVGLLATLAFRQGGWLGQGSSLLALGLISFVAADSVFLWVSLFTPDAGDSWSDPLWSVSFVLIALAARVSSRTSSGHAPATSDRISALVACLPYLAVTLCFSLAIRIFVRNPLHALDPVVFYGTILVTGLVVVRQLLALQDNARLTCKLRTVNRDLEARVQERTAELQQLAASLELRVQERTAELQASQSNLVHQATHDSLTDLPNRLLLQDRLRQALTIAAQEGTAVALMFIDLDGFKAVNDRLGHHAGDLLLREVAQRLTCTVRSSDTVARMGGDEFVIMLPYLSRREAAAGVGRKLMAALEAPFLLAGEEVRISASIGVSLFPDDTRDITALQQYADTAMYNVKLSGKKGLRFYSSGGPEHAFSGSENVL